MSQQVKNHFGCNLLSYEPIDLAGLGWLKSKVANYESIELWILSTVRIQNFTYQPINCVALEGFHMIESQFDVAGEGNGNTFGTSPS